MINLDPLSLTRPQPDYFLDSDYDTQDPSWSFQHWIVSDVSHTIHIFTVAMLLINKFEILMYAVLYYS